jgi:hypothetical protein
MGIFFKTEPAVVGDFSAEGGRPGRKRAAPFRWRAAILTAIGLLVILLAAFFAGRDPMLQDLYRLLLGSFQLLLGAFLGLIVGEKAAQEERIAASVAKQQ